MLWGTAGGIYFEGLGPSLIAQSRPTEYDRENKAVHLEETSLDTIAVVVAGVTGRTGEAVARAIHQTSDLRLVGAIAKNHGGEHLGARWSDSGLDLAVIATIDALSAPPSDAVLVDFTEAESAFGRLEWAIQRKWDVVVGTTGFSQEQSQYLADLVERHQVGAAFIANFSIGAWFLERVAIEASQYFGQAEIVEEHHAAKRDRPSGTARRMQELLAQSWKRNLDDIPVHSIRLPGLVAHQTVIFGSDGQSLSFRHDVHDRSAYAQGVVQAVRKVHSLKGRVINDLGEILNDH